MIKRILAIVISTMIVFGGAAFAQDGFSDVQEVTGSISSVGDDCVKSVVGEGVVSGRTVTNLLGDYGDCEDASKWSVYYGALANDVTKKVIGTQSIKATSDGTQNRFGVKETGISIKDNGYYLYGYWVYLPSSNSKSTTLCDVSIAGTTVTSDASIVTDKWFLVLCKLNVTDYTQITQIAVRLNAASGYANTDTVNFDGIFNYKITADEYNLSFDELRAKYNFVNDTKSTNSHVIRTTNKNLLSHNFLQRDTAYMLYDDGNDFIVFNNQGSTTVRPSSYIAVYLEKGKTYKMYKFNESATSGTGICYGWNIHDNQKNIINSYTFTSSYTATYTGLHYIAPYGGNSTNGSTVATNSKCQLMLIDTTISDTSYAKYQKSEVFFNGELNSIQDSSGNITTKDKVDFNTGIYTQNTGKKVLYGTDAWSEGSHTTNCYVFNIYNLVSNYYYQHDGVNKNNLYIGGKNFRYIYSTVDTEHFYFEPAGQMIVFIDRSKIDAQTGTTILDKWHKYLSTNQPTLIYELAEPQTSQINTAPLIAYPDGTITIEPIISHSSVYSTTTGLTISNTDLPIKDLISLRKIYVGEDNIVHRDDLDPLTAVKRIDNGTKIILNSGQDGETYQFVYRYSDELTTIPTFEYSYAISQSGQIEGNTNMIQQNWNLVNKLLEEVELLWDKLGDEE